MHHETSTASAAVLPRVLHPRPIAAAAILAAVALAAPAHAWVGGYELADGYANVLNMLQLYNAGQFGPNGGYGGSYSPGLTNGAGLWTAQSGGFFSLGTVSYATGHAGFDRQWINSGIGAASAQGCVITTGHEGWNSNPVKYKYNVDSPDLGGTVGQPLPTTAGRVVDVSFWTRPQLFGVGEGTGQLPDGYYGDAVEFLDTAGHIGMSVGITQRASGDTLTYWDGSTLFESATIIGSTSKFDQWMITLDLASQTVSAKYFQFTTGLTHTLVTSQPLMNTMGDFRSFTLRSSPGDGNVKGWAVDDFGFHVSVPAPGSAAVLGLAAFACGKRRRRTR